MGQDLRQMKTGEVAEQARKAGIPNVEQMDKGEMIEALESRGQGGSQQRSGGGQRQKDPAPPGVPPEQYKNIPGNQT